MTDIAPAFLQLGAVGAVALLAVYAVVKLFARTASQSDAAVAAERARADRLEKQLAESNTAMIDRFLPATLQATQLMGEVLAELRKDTRRGDQR